MRQTALTWRELWHKIGPGLITGASDDDPSGILTYLQAGAVLGTRGLWLVLITLPLMYGIQEMCARLGLVTGKGLIRLIKEHYSKKVLYFLASIAILVITINIGADLIAIGTVLEKQLFLSRMIWVSVIAFLIVLISVKFSYRRLANILKWLTLSLFAYVAVAFYIQIDWLNAISHTFWPSFDFTKEFWLLTAAVLGTTISPYLFFWQTSEEVEEREETRLTSVLKRFNITKRELRLLKADTFIGMAFSNIVMWFIIVSASQLSNLYGLSNIVTFDDAAKVLQPLLGNQAYFLFSLGIVGVGILAVPVLAGSVGYIISEVFNWSEGMNRDFHDAPGFYWAIVGATFLGAALTLLGLDPVKMLVYTAVAYTLITPPIIYYIIRLANNREIMKHKVNGVASNYLGIASLILMTLAAVMFLVT